MAISIFLIKLKKIKTNILNILLSMKIYNNKKIILKMSKPIKNYVKTLLRLTLNFNHNVDRKIMSSQITLKNLNLNLMIKMMMMVMLNS